MKEIQLDNDYDDNGSSEIELPHKIAAKTNESQNPIADLHGSNRGGLCYNIPTTTFQAGKHGGVSIISGSRMLQHTSDKRIFIRNSFRTVSYGFKGTLI